MRYVDQFAHVFHSAHCRTMSLQTGTNAAQYCTPEWAVCSFLCLVPTFLRLGHLRLSASRTLLHPAFLGLWRCHEIDEMKLSCSIDFLSLILFHDSGGFHQAATQVKQQGRMWASFQMIGYSVVIDSTLTSEALYGSRHAAVGVLPAIFKRYLLWPCLRLALSTATTARSV